MKKVVDGWKVHVVDLRGVSSELASGTILQIYTDIKTWGDFKDKIKDRMGKN